jgi:putative PEP-CTERM system TPR-repeat lipoprotein
VQRAEQALAKGDARAALIDFLKVSQDNPDNLPASAGVISASLALGDVQRARTELDRVRRQYSTAPEVEAASVKVMAAEGKWDEVARKYGGSGNVVLSQGSVAPLIIEALIRQRRFNEADQIIDERLKLAPGDFDILALKALSSFESGSPNRALMLLEGARARDPHPKLALLEAQLLLRLGSPDQSAQVLDGILRENRASLNPGARTALLAALAEVHLSTGRLYAALAAIEQAERLPAQPQSLRLMKARVLSGIGRASDARAVLESLRKDGSATPAIDCVEGQILAGELRVSDAETSLKKCLARFPGDVAARRTLARVLLRRGDNGAAREVLAPLRAVNPFDLEILRADLAALGEMTDSAAIQVIEQRFAASPKSPAVRVAAAQALLAVGSSQRASAILAGGDDWSGLERIRARLRLLATAQSLSPAELRNAIREYVSSSPDDPTAYLLANSVLTNRGFSNDAEAYLLEGLKRIPSSVDLLRQTVKQDLASGRLDSASDRLRKARSVDSTDPELALLEYRLKVAQGDQLGALASLQASVTGSPAPALKVELARARMAAGELDAAQSMIEALAKDGAPVRVIGALEGELLLRRGRTKEAVAALDKATKDANADPDALLRLALAQAADGDLGAAEKTVRSAISKSPDSIEATALLTQLLLQAKRPADARTAIEQLKRRLPEHPAPLQLEATLAQRAGDVPAARRLLGEAYRLRPSGDLALQRFALESASSPSAGLAVLRDGASRFPKDVRVALALSDASSNSGDRKGALEALEAVRSEQGPLRPVVLNNLAWMYFERGSPEALGLAREAAKLAPDQASILDTLGWILFRTGQPKEGLEVLRRASTADSANADIALHLIEAERIAGSRDAAEKLARELRARSPQLGSQIDAALGN